MEQPQQQPELLCPTSTTPQHPQPFVRAPSPPKPATEEHLAEVQLLVQSQYTASGAAVVTGRAPKSALKKRGASESGSGGGKKKGRVMFREFVVVAYTWSPSEYDRTSIQISPITNEDLISLYAYRAELEATTTLLTHLRDQAITEQIRQRRLLLQQQQHQKIALAMAAQAARAAVQAAAASYGWNNGLYPQTPYHNQFQPYQPLNHYNAFPGAGHPMLYAESARWANPIPYH